MKTQSFLIFTKRGVTRFCKTRPRLALGEYAVQLRIEVPDSVFVPDIRTVEVAITPAQIVTPVIEVGNV